MGLVSELLGSVTTTLSKVDGNRKRSGTGRDVDRGSTGEVEATLYE